MPVPAAASQLWHLTYNALVYESPMLCSSPLALGAWHPDAPRFVVLTRDGRGFVFDVIEKAAPKTAVGSGSGGGALPNTPEDKRIWIRPVTEIDVNKAVQRKLAADAKAQAPKPTGPVVIASKRFTKNKSSAAKPGTDWNPSTVVHGSDEEEQEEKDFQGNAEDAVTYGAEPLAAGYAVLSPPPAEEGSGKAAALRMLGLAPTPALSPK